MRTLLDNMMHVLDRLADGNDFNRVVEETGITAQVSSARNAFPIDSPANKLLDEMMTALDRLANGDGFNDVVEETRITAAVSSARNNPAFADSQKTQFVVGHNFTHAGHHMEPAVTITVPEHQLRDRLEYIINDVSRSCRIWVDGSLAWVYHGGNTVNPNPKGADEVLHELGLHDLAHTPAPAATPALVKPSSPSM